MNLRYISVGVLAVIIALFYFMHQSNEASAERLKQAEISNQQRLEQEKIATKREQEEARKLAEKEARESTKTPQSSGAESSVSMSFSDCKRIAASTGDELAGTQYKTTVHVDSSSFYEVEICTNDGSVDILCDGKKQEMTIFKMRKCSA